MRRLGDVLEGLLDDPRYIHPSLARRIREQRDRELRRDCLRRGICPGPCGNTTSQCECAG